MKSLVIKTLATAAAVWVAAAVIPGIRVSGGVLSLLVVAIVFGLVNAFVRPIVKFFSFGLVLLTLGLFLLVINALMLWLTAGLLDSFSVDGFMPAFLGSLLISVVSFVLSAIFDGKD